MAVNLEAKELTIIPRLRFGMVAYEGNIPKIINFCRKINTRWIMVFEVDDHETNLFPLPFWKRRFDQLKTIIDAFHQGGISVMFNMQVTFGHGGVSNAAEIIGFRRMKFPDGTFSPYAPCVLDERFQALVLEKYKLAVKAGFDVIFIDDDFRQAGQGRVGGGCFCEVHLDLLKKEVDRPLCAEEINRILHIADPNPEERRIRDAWNRIKREGLTGLGKRIVQEMREVQTDAHSALMICGISSAVYSNMDLAGLVESLCSINPVIIRPPDGGYSGYEHEGSMIFGAFHSAHITGLVAPDAVSTPDTDNMSRSRFGRPAHSYIHEALRHIGYGIKIFSPAILETVPTDWDDDKVCQEELVREFPRLRELAKLVERPLWKEEKPYLRIHFPLEMGGFLSEEEIENTIQSYFYGITYLLRLGFYVSPSKNRPRICIAGAKAVKVSFVEEILQDKQISVLLDGEAAWELCKMGYDSLIGCRVEPECGYYAYEYLKAHDAHGRYADSLIQCRNRVKREDIFRIEADPKAVVLSEIYDLDKRRLGDGVTLFEGRAGRMAIVPFSFRSFRSWVLSRRRVQLDWVFGWLARERPPVFIDGSPDILSLVHCGKSNTDIWLYNCSYDPTGEETRVHVRNCHGLKKVGRFDSQGKFMNVDEGRLERKDDEIILCLGEQEKLRFQELVVYRFEHL